MEEEQCKKYIGMKIFLETKTNNKYTLDVDSVEFGTLTGKDKFGVSVSIDCLEIELVEVKENDSSISNE